MTEKTDISSYDQQRTNEKLRFLIDSMLHQVRQMQRNRALWSVEKRLEADRQLENVMELIRAEAARNHQRDR